MNRRLKLRTLLAYRNPEVVHRFCKTFGVSEKIGNQVWRDMLRFFWLGYVIANGKAGGTLKGAVMFDSMQIVDEMWHTFLLFSRDYAAFCDKYMGYYIYHVPTPEAEKQAFEKAAKKKSKLKLVAKNPEPEPPSQSDQMIDLAWKQLGPEVARRWFHEYATKYPPHKLLKLQIAA
jgi:hypothetical protein